MQVESENLTHFTHPLHRDEERVREETGCVLSGGQKHSVGTEHCTAAHRAFGVETYFKNNKCMVKIIVCPAPFKYSSQRQCATEKHDKVMGTTFPKDSISDEETAT
jgi:hypothetical protein